MNAVAASEEQINRDQRMTGEQRLAVALELHELSCDVAREGLRRQQPGADANEVERLLTGGIKPKAIGGFCWSAIPSPRYAAGQPYEYRATLPAALQSVHHRPAQ